MSSGLQTRPPEREVSRLTRNCAHGCSPQSCRPRRPLPAELCPQTPSQLLVTSARRQPGSHLLGPPFAEVAQCCPLVSCLFPTTHTHRHAQACTHGTHVLTYEAHTCVDSFWPTTGSPHWVPWHSSLYFSVPPVPSPSEPLGSGSSASQHVGLGAQTGQRQASPTGGRSGAKGSRSSWA